MKCENSHGRRKMYSCSTLRVSHKCIDGHQLKKYVASYVEEPYIQLGHFDKVQYAGLSLVVTLKWAHCSKTDHKAQVLRRRTTGWHTSTTYLSIEGALAEG